MSERDRESKVERIVVAFDTTPLGEVALEAAAGLAAALDAELSGLFVEDVNLMRMAQLPFTRELGLVSAVIRPIEASDIERAFRLEAEHSREQLEHIAAALDLRWSFQVLRGHVPAAVLGCRTEVDLVVFGKAAHRPMVKSVRVPPRAGAVGREAQRHREQFQRLSLRPIALLFDGSERAWRALAVAFALAATAETRLTLLVSSGSREDFDRLRELAKAWLPERGAMARFAWLRNREALDIAQAVKAENAAALLWYDGATPQDRDRLQALLSMLGCPVVLIS